MSVMRLIDSPISWIIAGFGIGLGLGVTTASSWLVVAGLAAFIVYLRIHREAKPATEGHLFAAGVLFMMSWIMGFAVHGMAF